MTKEETKAYIKAYLDGDPAVGNIIPLRSVLESAIKYLSEPPLPSNMDEAADFYKDTVTPEQVDDSKHAISYETYTEYQIADAFKAGAEWMAGQGVSWEDKMTYYDGFLIYGQDERAYTMEGNFNEGDEVVVQIRKKY